MPQPHPLCRAPPPRPAPPQVKLSALFPLVDGGSQRVQPHHVRDVADAVMAVLGTEGSKGMVYYLGGPEVVT
jgi:uncharacterized protein YbjT (DUF2867 family)